MFVGHDHANSYVADYYGILLGYARDRLRPTRWRREQHRLRGARVHLDENVEGVLAGTELRLAADYGIDLTPEPRPASPRTSRTGCAELSPGDGSSDRTSTCGRPTPPPSHSSHVPF